MFFTRLATLLAWLGLLAVALHLGYTVYLANTLANAAKGQDLAYLASSGDLAKALSETVPVLAAVVALGVLAEISKTMRCNGQ